MLDYSHMAQGVEPGFFFSAASSVIDVVDALIEGAHRARASDIHFDPTETGLTVRWRVDGSLRDCHELPRSLHHELISRIKILSGLRTDEHMSAQDGRFRVAAGAEVIDVRVSIVPTYYGENAILRLLSDQGQDLTFERLGFSAENRAKILRAVKRPHGMILATGPTGSGKTTTLYALVKMLNTRDASIVTIEDPIEYSIAGINQIQVHARTGLTFGNGLRSLLRQDPNVIMVGEIRDIETAGLAVNTALTGHLVLSSLHTNDAATTLPRLLDMRVEPYLIASTVSVAIAQRLVRRICKHCAEEKNISDAELKSISAFVSPGDFPEGSIRAGKGCIECNGTGYCGRVGIHEVLEIDPVVREAILRKASAREIRDAALSRGMKPMIADGFQKILSGQTSIEEVLRVQYE